MAGVMVSASKGVKDSILEKLNDLILDNGVNLIGVSNDIRFLKEELPSMNALLEKLELEDTDELDPQVKDWRNQVREMTYDIEDCIDDFRSNLRSADAEASFIGKVSNFIVTFRARFDTAMEIKELKTRLQDISDRRKRYKVDDCSSSTAAIVTLDPRLPALYNEATSLVGIDNPKDELIKWVSDEDQKLKVLSIVGIGGLGKTTLANQVYRQVEGQFSCKAFVSVSSTPDVTRILNDMLSQLSNNKMRSASDVQYVMGSLRKYLQHKRYLVVVDDLWDVPPWNIIKCAFPESNQRSRVIVTTRHVNVAKACCSDHKYIHHMQRLSDSNSRKLFFKRISLSEVASQFQSSEAVLCEILKKCDGLPLAIITIASILACAHPGRLKEQWECIQNSLAIQPAANSSLDDMVRILDLSYKSLPHHLKSCFLYLGKYPEDYKIEREELVRKWVAEGFVRSYPERDVWDIAEGYFNELVNRNMVQPIYWGYSTEVAFCRVHDMVLDLILRRCREDNFINVVRDPQKVAEARYKVRRLSMDMSGVEDVTMTLANTSLLSQVRSLAMFGGRDWIPLLLEFKFVTVLFLEFLEYATGMDRMLELDLTSIIQLSQLRYLKIKIPRVVGRKIELPGQIQRLQHLETLELHLGFGGINLPSGIVDLLRLTHLVMPRLPERTRLPDGIGKVSLLRTLVGFSLRESSSENIRSLGTLTNLVEVHLLLNHGEETRNTECMLALSSALEKLSYLKRIFICAPGDCRGDALSSLSPHFRNLEELTLDGVALPRVPRWIGGLRDLRLLRLRVDEISNSDWEDVGIIGTLPFLVILDLRVTGVPADRIVITGFSPLKSFRFCCDGISRLSFEAGAMPNLRYLNFGFDGSKWDMVLPAGLEHLSSLECIIASSPAAGPRMEDDTVALIMGVFQQAAEALPTTPRTNFSKYYLPRP